jgi:hypothetical protein
MKKIRLSLPPITVIHPNDPDVTVTLNRPTPEDENEWRRTLSTYQKFVAVQHPETKEIIYKDHQPVMVPLPVVYPATVMFDYFEKRISDATGIETLDGNPMPWNKSNSRSILRGFMQRAFNVTEDRDVPELDEEGKPTGAMVKKPVETPWLNYLIDRLNSPEDLSDPLESRPAPPSSHSVSDGSA